MFFALARVRSGADSLRGAAARIDITPSMPVMLGGYASRTNLSQGIHDPLSARAMAFENGGKRLLFISLDNLGFYNNTAEPLRKAILDECHLEGSQLFLCAIHTHSAPILTLEAEKVHSNNVAYTKELEHKLVSLARQAIGEMQSVRLEFGVGSSPVGANRREVVRDTNGTRIVLGRNPNLLTDREVQVLKLSRAADDRALGVLFAYATHSTSLGPRNYLVSGDVHGLAAQFVEKYLGASAQNATDLVAPEFAGASGNIDPWYRVLPTFNTNNGWIPEPILLGTMLGEEVCTVAMSKTLRLTNSTIKSAIRTVQLPGKPRGQADPATVEGTTAMTITVASIGDTAFVGLGGEVFTEIGQAIKKNSPFARTFVLTHCNGAAGYLPTGPSYAQGGYEVQSSAFGPGADERLAGEVLGMLKELY